MNDASQPYDASYAMLPFVKELPFLYFQLSKHDKHALSKIIRVCFYANPDSLFRIENSDFLIIRCRSSFHKNTPLA